MLENGYARNLPRHDKRTRRWLRERAIKRRLEIARKVWNPGVLYENHEIGPNYIVTRPPYGRPLGISPTPWDAQPGRLAKYNLVCGCRTCRLGRERYKRDNVGWKKLIEEAWG